MAEPSADLIRWAQAGDPQALTELILSQQHYVYSIAMSIFRNPDDAADLTQEAFIRLCRSIRLYTGESRFTTWLYRLVVNLCRDELRRRGRQVPILTADALAREDERHPVNTVADDGAWGNPVRMLDDEEQRKELRLALARLDDHYRLALTLYYFDEMKYTEIAKILDMPLNTVKSHIRRGKERLAQIVAEMAEAAPSSAERQQERSVQQQPQPEAPPRRSLGMALL